MKLAIFDLDNTLIAGDSDFLWGKFLEKHGHIDPESQQAGQREAFYRDYQAGKLDIFEFLNFQLRPLADTDIGTLLKWRNEYLREMIDPIILPKASELIETHRSKGHTLLIITATNRFLTEPIAQAFNIDNLIACEPEMQDGRYTGRVTGTPSFAQGKVSRWREWMQQQQFHVEKSWFYSDSHNDIPLLEQVEHPFAVDPDVRLKQAADERDWPVISLR